MLEINLKINDLTNLIKHFQKFSEEKTKTTSDFNYTNIFIIFTIILIIQYLITYYYTNTKWFSYLATIRNLSLGLGIYFFLKTYNCSYLLLPLFIELSIILSKHYGFHFEKYIATEYQYNDYWRNIVKENNIFASFSEGNYDGIFGIDTKDHSEENLKKILKWTNELYNNAHKNKTSTFYGINGEKFENMEEIQKIGLEKKFESISEMCNINSSMRILEIGFGEGDFMIYLKEKYGINTIGISISQEQVDLMKSRGFQAYKMDMWDMTPEFLGEFDLILQLGNLEYCRCTGESSTKYTDYFEIVKKILKPNGLFFITCIHCNNNIMDKFTFYDYIRGFFLLYSNDGAYPAEGKYALLEHAEKANLTIIKQEERTNDYWITSVIYSSAYEYYFKNKKNSLMNLNSFVDAMIKTIAGPFFIHVYLCYTPTSDYYWVPWNWQFIPQQKGEQFISPVNLQYILFKNTQ
jgi:cyclopropane fatty-acyl-phospholipid synthase-like methyltransferase